MSKVKKLVAGALAAVICATSFAAPATANAATNCSHNIYKAGTIQTGTSSFNHTVYVETVQFRDVYVGGFIRHEIYKVLVPRTYTCTVNSYRDVYACYKCNYSYMGGTYSTTSHSH